MAQDGTHTSFGELKTEVERSLALAPQLRPHLTEFRKQYQLDPIKWVRYPQYRLYIVALRPTVIVGVPATSTLSHECYTHISKCFTVSDPRGWSESRQSFSGWTGGVYYGERPPVVAGAFAYVPAANAEAVNLPAEQPEVILHLANREIKLVNTNGLWQILQ